MRNATTRVEATVIAPKCVNQNRNEAIGLDKPAQSATASLAQAMPDRSRAVREVTPVTVEQAVRRSVPDSPVFQLIDHMVWAMRWFRSDKIAQVGHVAKRLQRRRRSQSRHAFARWSPLGRQSKGEALRRTRVFASSVSSAHHLAKTLAKPSGGLPPAEHSLGAAGQVELTRCAASRAVGSAALLQIASARIRCQVTRGTSDKRIGAFAGRPNSRCFDSSTTWSGQCDCFAPKRSRRSVEDLGSALRSERRSSTSRGRLQG